MRPRSAAAAEASTISILDGSGCAQTLSWCIYHCDARRRHSRWRAHWFSRGQHAATHAHCAAAVARHATTSCHGKLHPSALIATYGVAAHVMMSKCADVPLCECRPRIHTQSSMPWRACNNAYCPVTCAAVVQRMCTPWQMEPPAPLWPRRPLPPPQPGTGHSDIAHVMLVLPPLIGHDRLRVQHLRTHFEEA
jgi:hypothetical protein